ncbi:MAG: hydantoinase/oxoprolinase family protein [Ktedonobacterales bacterium]
MLLGADIGGTFTDLVWWTGEKLITYKISTTPATPEDGLLAGIEYLHANRPDVLLVHGSTIATNAFLERKGARTLLVTTAGFADALEIGRQNRIGIYDARTVKPVPLVPAERRMEVRERIDAHGEVLEPLTEEEVLHALDLAREQSPEAIAICLLHAYAHPAHERLLGEALRGLSPFVYLSSEIDPGYREYERMSTTVLNAYIAPAVAGYLERLRGRLHSPLRLLGSNGGRQTTSELARPASMILSGPAGGIIGAHAVARAAGEERIITLDMGGTSTDVALIAGEPLLTRETLLEGLPIRAPMLDIYTIGAGGGSLARFDRGGALVVGPESAGAQPGPASYGRGGTSFTVTDAHVVLGHILPDQFLGGRMELDTQAAEQVGRAAMGDHMPRLTDFAEGVLAVANAAMERAIRAVSARRGYDPAEFVLLCFGGAGGLHAVSLARALGMRGVLIPRLAGTLSALGMALADTQTTTQASILRDLSGLDDAALKQRFADLADGCLAELEENSRTLESMPGSRNDEATPSSDQRVRYAVEPALDMRYRGQSYELLIPWQGDVAATAEAFHREHERRFGYARPDGVMEVVNAVVTARERTAGFALPELPEGDAPSAPLRNVEAWFEGQPHTTALYLMEQVARDQQIDGPAILAGEYATVLIPPGATAHADRFGNIHVPLL